MLCHIALRDEWDAAVATGSYRRSTRGLGLDEVGFIHLSRPHQVAGTANRFYRDAPGELVLLVIEPALVGAEVRDARVGDEVFPHLYGPLPVAAVTAVLPLPPDPTGHFTVPEWLLDSAPKPL